MGSYVISFISYDSSNTVVTYLFITVCSNEHVCIADSFATKSTKSYNKINKLLQQKNLVFATFHKIQGENVPRKHCNMSFHNKAYTILLDFEIT
jgi:hypothetical protein